MSYTLNGSFDSNRVNNSSIITRSKVNGDLDSDDESIEMDDDKLNTPKSVRDNTFNIRRTTIKVPLKDDNLTNTKANKRPGTPTTMDRLTKYKSRNGTPLKRKVSIEDDREISFIRDSKLISDDNRYSPHNTPGRSFLKPTSIKSSPMNVNFEKTMGSPPQFRIRTDDFKDDTKSSRPINNQENSELNVHENMKSDDNEYETIEKRKNNDIEFDSSEDENPSSSKPRHLQPSSQQHSTSQQPSSPQRRSPPQQRQSPKQHQSLQQRSSPPPSLPPMIPSILPQAPMTRDDPRIPSHQLELNERNGLVGQSVTSIPNMPQGQHGHHVNIASSVEAESISTTLDKGSLQVGIPSRIDVERERAEVMEKIDPRMSFEDNEIDLESGISSDDNPVELLQELDSFLPKSSPKKDSSRNNPTVNPVSTSRINTGAISNIRINIPELTPIRRHYGRLNERFSRHLNNKRKQERKFPQSELQTQFELTEIEKEEIPEPESPEEEAEREEEKDLDEDQGQEFERMNISHQNSELWTNYKWNKLNKLIKSDKFTIKDILDSHVLIKWLGCKSKEDLKQRIEFLIKFNEYRQQSSLQTAKSNIGKKLV